MKNVQSVHISIALEHPIPVPLGTAVIPSIGVFWSPYSNEINYAAPLPIAYDEIRPLLHPDDLQNISNIAVALQGFMADVKTVN